MKKLLNRILNKMKQTVTILIIWFLSFCNVNAQLFYDNSEIIPEKPSSSDSINVVGNIKFLIGFEEICPPLSGFNTSILDTAINLELFYDVSGVWPQSGCTTSFIINIGVVDPGNYLCSINTNTIFDFDTTFHIDSDTLMFNVSNSSSINEDRLTSLISIYPIPVNKYLILDFPDYLNIKSLILFNLQGKRILRFDNKSKKLCISGIEPGLYFLRVVTNKGSVIKKVIVK